MERWVVFDVHGADITQEGRSKWACMRPCCHEHLPPRDVLMHPAGRRDIIEGSVCVSFGFGSFAHNVFDACLLFLFLFPLGLFVDFHLAS
jgi:hypothetical protein